MHTMGTREMKPPAVLPPPKPLFPRVCIASSTASPALFPPRTHPSTTLPKPPPEEGDGSPFSTRFFMCLLPAARFNDGAMHHQAFPSPAPFALAEIIRDPTHPVRVRTLCGQDGFRFKFFDKPTGTHNTCTFLPPTLVRRRAYESLQNEYCAVLQCASEWGVVHNIKKIGRQ